jgi:succinate dehydrogenase / fumarate reductase iron-sulfur subunit
MTNISRMNNDYFSAKLFRQEAVHDHASGGE